MGSAARTCWGAGLCWCTCSSDWLCLCPIQHGCSVAPLSAGAAPNAAMVRQQAQSGCALVCFGCERGVSRRRLRTRCQERTVFEGASKPQSSPAGLRIPPSHRPPAQALSLPLCLSLPAPVQRAQSRPSTLTNEVLRRYGQTGMTCSAGIARASGWMGWCAHRLSRTPSRRDCQNCGTATRTAVLEHAVVRQVVMPIPRPVTGHEVDSYKIMLSIAGETYDGVPEQIATCCCLRR